MGWPITDWQDSDWSAVAVVNAFVDAVQERHKALNCGTPHLTITRRVTKTQGTCTVVGTALTATEAKFPEEGWGVASQFRPMRIVLASGTCSVEGVDLTATVGVFKASHVGHHVMIDDFSVRGIAAYVSPTEVTLDGAADCEDLEFYVYGWFNIVGWVSATQVTLDDDATGAGMDFTVEGDDVQLASWWSAIQGWVEENLASFVVCADGGVMRDPGHYHDSASPPTMYATLAEVFAATDLENETWRRYETHPDEDGDLLTGVVWPGSIIGPWQFEDLQKVLDVLVWTSPQVTWVESETYVVGLGEGDDGAWWTAVGLASADWGTNGAVGDPYAHTGGKFDTGRYYAVTSRGIARGQLLNVWDGVGRSVEWYVKVDKYPGAAATWHTQGDTGIIQDKYSLWLTDAPGTDDPTVLSSASLVAGMTEPAYWKSAPTGFNWETHGWVTYYEASVVRWDIDGGFGQTFESLAGAFDGDDLGYWRFGEHQDVESEAYRMADKTFATYPDSYDANGMGYWRFGERQGLESE